MRKYFIVIGYQRKGPYTLEELKENNITKETIIWFFELGEPTPAGEIEEIASVFSDVENKVVEEKIIPGEEKEKNAPSDEELMRIYAESQKPKKEQKIQEPELKEVENIDEVELIEDEKEEKIAEIVESVKNEKEKKIVEFQSHKEVVIPIVQNNNFTNEPEENSIVEEEISFEEPENFEIKYEETNKYQNAQYSSNSSSFNSGGAAQPKPPNYLVASILATILCCLPLGVIGIIFSSQVDKKYSEGDYAGATQASNTAKGLLLFSIILGIILMITMFVIGANG
ncbi:MAG: CD225/dispanin family protein [Bacteroidales bacterium]|nr:CD225/dispanin family protein [Bacteroidales bacterium]